MVKCRICGKEVKQINWLHLRKHNITFEEYKKKFPECGTDERDFPDEIHGGKRSEEDKKKIAEGTREAMKNFRGEDNPFCQLSPEERSEVVKKGWNEERKKRWSEKFSKNNPSSRKEVRKKISRTHIKKEISKGRNNPNFKGWSSKEPYGKDWTEKLKEKVRKKNNYECFFCEIPQSWNMALFTHKLHVHHLDGDKKNCDIENLIPLCNYCHMRMEKNFSFTKGSTKTLPSDGEVGQEDGREAGKAGDEGGSGGLKEPGSSHGWPGLIRRVNWGKVRR